MTYKIRRFVTGNNILGQSSVIKDDTGYSHTLSQFPDIRVIELWRRDPFNSTPSDLEALMPPRQGSAFRVCEFLPHNAINFDSTQPMHQTQTTDYAIVLAGEITLILENETINLVAGDVVIQQSTLHAWKNTSSQSAFVAFVLIDAATSN